VRFSKFIQQAAHPVSAAPFVSFRIVFGLLMAFSTLRFVWLGWIEDHYTDTLFHFHYFGFSWVEPLSIPALYVVHILMLLASLGVATGYFYRISAVVLFFTFTYTELLDLTYYLNHYYFVSLVCLWLMFMPEPGSNFKIPAWCRWLIMFQLGLVYFYAGLAKINTTWLLEAMPLRIWLPAHDDLPVIGSFLAIPEAAWVFSWCGMLYDISIPFLLLYRKTRSLAYLFVVIFHLLTGLLFQIGVFPLVMIGSTIIFFSNEWHHRFLALIGRIPLAGKAFRISASQDGNGYLNTNFPSWLKFMLIVHVAFQLLFPWRYLLYPGNLFWTEEGYRFSWRVMLVEKAGDAAFYIKDSQTGREGLVNNREFLNAHQEKQMSFQPDMILQFAHFLGNHYKNQGVNEPQVRAEVYVTMNARKSQLLIDPKIDLMKLEDGWAPKKWILPWQQ
jgi:uncharacterized membrane protein YphA (DoxX/SURF4 family)